ncbi:hypothetical protein [Parafrankia sp. FMc2]|uniref:hypothetical protein n=1 Tax=Parafrankia sp. FMc2 TaxID=3233196 RepID=UPI0034D50814
MNALVALIAFALGLAFGISAAASYTQDEASEREKALRHSLTVLRHATKLPSLFWETWADYVAQEAAEAAEFAREAAAEERQQERTQALQELRTIDPLGKTDD